MKEAEVNNAIVKELYANRWKIIITTIIFIILSLTLYFFSPKKFTSEAVVYPTSSNNIDEVISNPSFGFEVQADRTIQLFESQMMQDRIVEQFDLISYYKLDTNSTEWFHKLNTFYSRDIVFARTQHQSVMVRVSMKDPQLAADIANMAVSYLDTIQKTLFLNNLVVIKNEIQLNIENQQKELDQILMQIIEGDSTLKSENPIAANKLNQLKFQKQIGESQSGDAIIIEALKEHPSFLLEKQINEYYIKLNSINSLKVKLEELDKTISLPFPGLYVVSYARPNAKPTSPKLFWNLGFGLFIGLILSIGFVLTRSGLKNFKKSIETN